MLVSVITVLVTLLLGILGFIVNTLLQRQNNSIDVITKNRITRRSITQNLMATFYRYSDYNSVKAVISLDKSNDVICELYGAFATLRSMYTKTFVKDIELLKESENLLNIIVKCINGFDSYSESEISNNLKEAKEKFEFIFDLYLHTDWNRIKIETIGKKGKGGGKDWLADFEKHKEWYKNY